MSDSAPTDTASPPVLDVRDVAAPIPMANIKEFFTNKNVYFRVSYTDSRLKGAALLTYLANVALPSDIRFDEPMPEEDFHELLKAYMDQRTVCLCPAPALLCAQLMLLSKGVPFDQIPYETGVPEAYFTKFIQDNTQQIIRWLHFIDSSVVFGLSAVPKLRDELGLEQGLERIDDRDYVGQNIVNLYTVPAFTRLYFALPLAMRESYFVRQFEDYMFANKRLEHYFNHVNNFLAPVLGGLASGAIDVNNPLEFFNPEKEFNVQQHLRTPEDGQLPHLGGDASSGQLPPESQP